MNTNTYGPCDLKTETETVFCPMFKECNEWLRCGELFTTLAEARAIIKHELMVGRFFGDRIPELRIVKSTFELVE